MPSLYRLILSSITFSKMTLLSNAINSINVGFETTNLYGSITEGLGHWYNDYGTNNIVQGFLMVFTDGTHTYGNDEILYNEMIQARDDYNKQIYSIGLGNEVDFDILGEIGNAGFSPIENANELVDVFVEIQEEMEMFADSFYWLYYLSPKFDGLMHTLTLSIIENINTGVDSYIEQEFSSEGFYPVYSGLYINTEDNMPYGIDDLIVSDTTAYQLLATTYANDYPPDYYWSSADTNIVRIEIDNLDNSKAYLYANGESGGTTITVYDNANTGGDGNVLEKIIDIDCTV